MLLDELLLEAELLLLLDELLGACELLEEVVLELPLTLELTVDEDELAVDEEESLLLLVTVDVVSELEYVEEESLLVFSCSLVVLVILEVIEVFGLPKQPLNIKAKAAIMMGSFLFLFIVLHYIRTKAIKKDRYFNNGLFNLMV